MTVPLVEPQPPGASMAESRVAERSTGLWSWLRAHPLPIVLVLALLVRLALIPPHVSEVGRGDPARFVYQAEHLLAGDGYIWRGKLCAHLPPGYPFFIAGIYSIHRSNVTVIAVQLVLSLVSCALVYLAIRPRSTKIACIAAIAMAVHLWSAYYCWQLMSECLGAFLASVLIYLVAREESDGDSEWKRRWRFALMGVTAAAAVLTCPGMLVLVAGLLAAAMIWNRRHPVSALAMLAGFAVLMAPWQMHCLHTLGRFVPQILDTTLHTSRGLATWQRTWMVRTKAPHQSAWGYFLWDTPGMTIAQIPARAFRSDEERTRLQNLVQKWRATGASIPEREKVFEPIAEERIAESPLTFYVGLPLVRSALLWVEMPNVSYAQLQYVGKWSTQSGTSEAQRSQSVSEWRTIGQAAFSNVAFLLHGVFLLYFAVLAVGALASRRLMALTLLFGLLGYTFASAYLSISEFRRNLPFIPILLFLAFYWPKRWGGSRRTHAP